MRERERDSNPISRLETSSGEMSLRPGCSCQATIITIKEEEHEDGDEDGDGAGRDGGSEGAEGADQDRHHDDAPQPQRQGRQEHQ